MEEFARADSRVKVLHNHINLNIGVSIQRGFAISSKDYTFFNSVDLPLNPWDIKGIIKNNDEFDLLVLERRSYRALLFGANSPRK